MTMKVFILFSFIGIQFLVSSTEAVNNCGRGLLEGIYTWGEFQYQKSCTWSIEAPVNHKVELDLSISIASIGSGIEFDRGDKGVELLNSTGVYNVMSTGPRLTMGIHSTGHLSFGATYRFIAPTTTTPQQKTTQILPIKTTIGSKVTSTKQKIITTQMTTMEPCKTKSGTLCVFPFIYNKTRYETCTTVQNDGVAWCPTTLHESGEAKAYEECSEDCPTGGPVEPNKCKTRRGFECQFPFRYYGIAHSKCVTLDSDKPWCAVSTDLSTGEVSEWAYCNSLCQVEPEYSGPDCVTVAEQTCIIPFEYKGVEYTKCATVDNNGVKWCATSTYNGTTIAKYWNDCQLNNTKC